MTDNVYLNAWVVYWAGTVILLLVGWRISRRWPTWLKYPLLLLLAAVFLVPFNIESGAQALAPAWLVLMFEGVFIPDVGFMRVGPTLAIAAMAALLLYPLIALFVALVKKLMGGNRTVGSADAQ